VGRHLTTRKLSPGCLFGNSNDKCCECNLKVKISTLSLVSRKTTDYKSPYDFLGIHVSRLQSVSQNFSRPPLTNDGIFASIGRKSL